MATPEQGAVAAEFVARHLRITAREERVSQHDLALAAGVSRSAMSEYLNARTPMPVHVFMLVCDKLDLDAGALLSEGMLHATLGEPAETETIVERALRILLKNYIRWDESDREFISEHPEALAEAARIRDQIEGDDDAVD